MPFSSARSSSHADWLLMTQRGLPFSLYLELSSLLNGFNYLHRFPVQLLKWKTYTAIYRVMLTLSTATWCSYDPYEFEVLDVWIFVFRRLFYVHLAFPYPKYVLCVLPKLRGDRKFGTILPWRMQNVGLAHSPFPNSQWYTLCHRRLHHHNIHKNINNNINLL